MQAMAEGMVVPLLGAGVNLCGRPPGAGWEHGRYLPDGAELADILAGHFRSPEGEAARAGRAEPPPRRTRPSSSAARASAGS
jgi:hypothetical protein